MRKMFKLTDETRVLIEEMRKLSSHITYQIRMNDGCTDEYVDELQAKYKAKRAEFDNIVEYV